MGMPGSVRPRNVGRSRGRKWRSSPVFRTPRIDRFRIPSWVFLGLLLTAWLVLLPASAKPWELIPGDGATPDLQGTAQYHWLTHERGLVGVSSSRMQMYPATVDRLAFSGVPLDGLASWPFVKALGWPAGFTVFWVVVLWGLGVAYAWLAGAWWGSPVAAFVGGVLAQTSAPLLRELHYGRPTQVFAAIFFPLALGWFARALTSNSHKDALCAGFALALCALSYWFFGFFCALAMLVIWGCTLIEGRPTRKVVGFTALSAGLPTFLPAAYTFAALKLEPSMNLGLKSVFLHEGQKTTLSQVLERSDLWSQIPQGLIAFLPFVFVLVVCGFVRQRASQRTVPMIWILVGLLLAMGPWLFTIGGVQVPGPWQVITEIPVLRRLWWPDRAMIVAVAGTVVLGAGGAAWGWEQLQKSARFQHLKMGGVYFSVGIASCLIIEAMVGLNTLPMPATQATVSERAAVLSKRTGPLLILPQAAGPYREGRQMLFDQIHHGRPLVNGVFTSGSSTPTATRDLAAIPPLSHLQRCASQPDAAYAHDAELGRKTLRGLGITTVYVDGSAFPEGKADSAYLSCVAELLGSPASQDGVFQIYPL